MFFNWFYVPIRSTGESEFGSAVLRDSGNSIPAGGH
jgi:hypothetical protein